MDSSGSYGYIFAFQVLPTIIFFSALTSLLFYYGILQKVVYAFAWLMKRSLKLSGAESLAAAANIFLGQTEAPLLVKPYISKMTNSELLCLMSGGMATIAGGVLAAYIGFLGGESDAQKLFFAKHLLVASVMSAPAAIIAAKIILPETKKPNQAMQVDQANAGSNALEAITNGTTQGLKLALNVGAMLLVFLALIAMANFILEDLLGQWLGLNSWVAAITNNQYDGFSLQFILGYVLAPITWLTGVANQDLMLVGQLLGEKTVANEFVAYVSLGEMMQAGAFSSPKSIIIATYILCGFSNFASIGIQIGGIGATCP
ncbi:MAG: nucleoside transporter C-terminal domain-containing protein [Owenweeksia sp.]|nr:nucleoside transporter C-terminal domain-containing protein [Owenweeksia sp.]